MGGLGNAAPELRLNLGVTLPGHGGNRGRGQGACLRPGLLEIWREALHLLERNPSPSVRMSICGTGRAFTARTAFPEMEVPSP